MEGCLDIMGIWKFFLADSEDLTLQRDITQEARNKELNLSFNRPGNCSFNLPLNGDTYDNSKTNNKAVVILKNGKWVWSGPIWTRNINLNEEKIEISAVGWFEILMYRLIDYPRNYSSAASNEGQIVFDLLNLANQDHPTWITEGTNTATTPRSKILETFTSIGQAILDLSDTEDGFDIYVDPETRQMSLREWDEFVDRKDIMFGYNWGSNNIASLTIEENGGEMRNRYIVTGNTSEAYVYPATSSEPPSQSQIENNLMTEVLQITEEGANSNFLQAVANAHGAAKEFPLITYQIELKPQGPANPYELFEDYNLGDRIYFTAQKQIGGRKIIFSHSPRIFGATISIDENGREVVSSLQTTFSG
jgi:hypothetical protein